MGEADMGNLFWTIIGVWGTLLSVVVAYLAYKFSVKQGRESRAPFLYLDSAEVSVDKKYSHLEGIPYEFKGSPQFLLDVRCFQDDIAQKVSPPMASLILDTREIENYGELSKEEKAEIEKEITEERLAYIELKLQNHGFPLTKIKLNSIDLSYSETKIESSSKTEQIQAATDNITSEDKPEQQSEHEVSEEEPTQPAEDKEIEILVKPIYPADYSSELNEFLGGAKTFKIALSYIQPKSMDNGIVLYDKEAFENHTDAMVQMYHTRNCFNIVFPELPHDYLTKITCNVTTTNTFNEEYNQVISVEIVDKKRYVPRHIPEHKRLFNWEPKRK